MYNEIKKHWDGQYRLSSNALFAQFSYNLERGGVEAVQFITDNGNFVESIVGSPERISEIVTMIKCDQEAVENQKYFFAQSQKELKKINELLQNKFNGTVGFAQFKGIETDGLDANTLMPTIYRKYNNVEDDEMADSDEPPTMNDEQPLVEVEETKRGRKKKIENENHL